MNWIFEIIFDLFFATIISYSYLTEYFFIVASIERIDKGHTIIRSTKNAELIKGQTSIGATNKKGSKSDINRYSSWIFFS